MHQRHLISRAMAALLTVAALLGTAAPIGAATAVGSPGRAIDSTGTGAAATASLADYGQSFHFLQPLAPDAGDATKFDPTLLKELVVSICRVDSTGCPVVKTITSSSSLAEQLRIMSSGGIQSFYQANWDTSGFKLTPSTFRISVTVDRLQLGSVDVTASQYKSFPRTWPIKFRIEKNPVIRVRVLHEAGKGASQIGNAIKAEFGICGTDLASLLVNDLDPFSQQDADLAVAGVCQNADIPSTTKVADAATQNALTSFDTSTGRLTFSTSTATLNNLKVADVLVSEPSAAAPNGYLRKVTAITRNKKTGVVIVDTADALINEAIHAGTLNGAGELKPSDVVSTSTAPGVTFTTAQAARPSATPSGLADVGDGFDFHDSIDVWFDGATGDPDISGQGKVHLQGELKFNAGWNVGMGIEGCLHPPFFTCVDRFETHVGAHFYSDLKVSGTFDGQLHKDYTLSIHYFKPIIFFVGPIPVVLVPVVKAVVGARGDAHVTFSFETKATGDLAIGAKWTDPDDGGNGWKDVSDPLKITGTGDGSATAKMTLRGYGAFDGKILLYGILGPGLVGRVGLLGVVQFPGDPLWELWAIANGELNFTVSLGGIMDLGGWHGDLPEVNFHLAQSANQPPTCSGQTSTPIVVAPNHPVRIGPSNGGFNDGYFSCADPEGGLLHNYVGMEGTTGVNLDSQGWADGNHDVMVTVEDDHNQTSTPITLHFQVVDTPPILDVTTAGGHIRAGVQYFLTASAWDVETGSSGDFLPCTAIQFDATGGSVTLAASNRTCTAAVVFTQTGTQTITVTATDPGNKVSQHVVTVVVGSPPANAAPIITMDSFSVTAATGPKVGCTPGHIECLESCPSGFSCPVPMDSILYNGAVGPFHTPLTMSVEASDPDGAPLTIHWYCLVGAYLYTVTDNGDDTFSCSPYSASITTPIYVWATVSDGTTTVQTELRRFYMLDRVI